MRYGNIWANSILNKGNKSRALNKPHEIGLVQGLKGVTVARTLPEKVKTRPERKPDARPCRSVPAMNELQDFMLGYGDHWKILRVDCYDVLYTLKGLLGKYVENMSGVGLP